MSILHKSVGLARALYRQSLRLLPRRFYTEYAEQMALDFDDLLQDTAHQGNAFLVAKTMLRAIGDVFLSAVRERVAMLHGEVDARPVTPRAYEAIAIASAEADRSAGVSADGRTADWTCGRATRFGRISAARTGRLCRPIAGVVRADRKFDRTQRNSR